MLKISIFSLGVFTIGAVLYKGKTSKHALSKKNPYFRNIAICNVCDHIKDPHVDSLFNNCKNENQDGCLGYYESQKVDILMLQLASGPNCNIRKYY